MSHRAGINVDPTSSVCQQTRTNKVRGLLWWHHVNHVVVLHELTHGAISGGLFERCLLRFAVDSDQTTGEVNLNAVGMDVLHQRWHILGHAE